MLIENDLDGADCLELDPSSKRERVEGQAVERFRHFLEIHTGEANGLSRRQTAERFCLSGIVTTRRAETTLERLAASVCTHGLQARRRLPSSTVHYCFRLEVERWQERVTDRVASARAARLPLFARPSLDAGRREDSRTRVNARTDRLSPI